MSAFLSGASAQCGPTSALKNVSDRINVDRSLQQDRLAYTANASGSSSKQPFRAQLAQLPVNQSPKQVPGPPSAFDLSSLRQQLSPVPSASHVSDWASDFAPLTGPAPSRYTHTVASTKSGWQEEFSQHVTAAPPPGTTRSQKPLLNAGLAPWQVPAAQYQLPRPALMQPSFPPHDIPISEANLGLPQPNIQAAAPIRTRGEQIGQPTGPEALPLDESQELLARTARSFINNLETQSDILSANPKLAQSKFMSLLRGLGDEEIVVKEGQEVKGEEVGEGATFVERNIAGDNWGEGFAKQGEKSVSQEASTLAEAEYLERRSPYPPGQKVYPALNSWVPALPTHTSVPPQTAPQATPLAANSSALWDQQYRDQEALIQSSESLASERRKNVHFDEHSASQERSGVPSTLEEALSSPGNVPGAGWGWNEQGLTHDFDEDVFGEFNGQLRRAQESLEGGAGKQEGWDRLQSDWEEFQRAEPGVAHLRGMGAGDQTERYMFQSRNPYSADAEDLYFEVSRDSPTLRGILELESEVQKDPTSHEAWYALGLKQQENEREDQAILALSKVIQLNPQYRPAYLALAVSYTNEGENEAACTMLEDWIKLKDIKNATGADGQKGRNRDKLIESLIEIARQTPHEIDADVQVALGVLFNMSGGQDYSKAEDCFLAALEARPEDWLLYNRLGATLANSGRSNEAIQYYHQALRLHPSFVRALLNLGIAYMNLGKYQTAAQSILDALRLQHSEASEAYAYGQNGGGAKGVTSETLWNSLKGACFYMNRHDLVKIVEKRDLSGLPLRFVDEEL
ncbi:peroxin-5 [Cryptococcus neoformans Bt1]|nr:peroxin-5 [Cryptococcus neoformans var. grubii Bt1]